MITLYLLKISKFIKLKIQVNYIYKNETLCMMEKHFHLNNKYNIKIH